MDLVAGLGLALVMGFGAGFLTFKRSLMWCPECGAILQCRECPAQPASHAIADTELRRGMCGVPRL